MKGFRKIDCSFYGGRLQSEVANEIPHEEVQEVHEDIPISGTPEQLIRYYTSCLNETHDVRKKSVYMNTISFLKELLSLQKEIRVYKLKELMNDISASEEENETLSQEIEEG